MVCGVYCVFCQCKLWQCFAWQWLVGTLCVDSTDPFSSCNTSSHRSPRAHEYTQRSAVAPVLASFVLKELSPTRNQLPWKTHEKTKKLQLQKLSTSASRCRETPSLKNQKKKSAIRAGPNRCRTDVPVVSEIGFFLFKMGGLQQEGDLSLVPRGVKCCVA